MACLLSLGSAISIKFLSKLQLEMLPGNACPVLRCCCYTEMLFEIVKQGQKESEKVSKSVNWWIFSNEHTNKV